MNIFMASAPTTLFISWKKNFLPIIWPLALTKYDQTLSLSYLINFKAKYTGFETKEDELIKALNNDLKVEESKDGFQSTKDPWTTNIQLMNQYEIKGN